jgi:predicted acyltransferase
LWSVLLAEILVWQQDGKQMSAYQWLFDQIALLLPDKLASLVFALLHVLWFWWLSRWLYRRNIFIKI